MHQNKFSFEVLYAMIVRILWSTYWDLLWRIKTNFLLKYYMQCLQEYYFLDVGKLCDASKKSFQVLFAVIAWVLFSWCWDILWWIKTHFFWSDVCCKIIILLVSTWCSVISASHIPCYTFIIVTSVSDVCIWEIPCANLPYIPCYTFIIAVNDIYIWEIPCVTLARRTKVGHGYSSMCHLVTFHVTPPL